MRTLRTLCALALPTVSFAACAEPPTPPSPDATLSRDAVADRAEVITDVALEQAPDATAAPSDASDAPDAGDADEGLDARDATGDAAPEARRRCDGDAGLAGVRVRIATANLTSGNLQTYEAPGVRIFQALRPDVVMIQEFRSNTGTLRALVDTAFGPTFQFFVEEPSTTGIPNGIVSRYPIVEAGEWDDPRTTDRDFVWAHLDVPGPVDLWTFTVHLLRSSPEVRASQAADLLARIAARVPPGDLVVVGGDLNANVETEPVLTTFGAALHVGPPYPMDHLGNNRTSGNRSRPYDWLLTSPALAAREVPLRVGDWCYASGLVFDSRVFSPLGDVDPVLGDDSAAVNMQHMLVARDYVLAAP